MRTARLLLTSLRLDPLPAMISTPPAHTRVLYVPTAAAPYDDPYWTDADRAALDGFGYDFYELDIRACGRVELRDELAATDVLVVAGGNTYFLLQEMVRTGFDHLVRDYVAHGGAYVGISAGAVVAGPDIAAVRNLDDRAKAPLLRSTAGLGLVDFVPMPHYGAAAFVAEYERIVAEFSAGPYPLVPLSDEQAVAVDGGVWDVITLPARRPDTIR